MMRLTEAQLANLRDIGMRYTRGEHAGACAALERRGLIRGDWDTGYYITRAGRAVLDALDAPDQEDK